MGFLKKLFSGWRGQKEKTPEEKMPEKDFHQYIMQAPKVLTYLRRDAGIARKELELLVIDEPLQPAWRIYQILEQLIPELNVLYLATGREDAYEELVEEAFEERGLILVLLSLEEREKRPGNLVLDLRDWEKHLDIINQSSYNFLVKKENRPIWRGQDRLEGVEDGRKEKYSDL